MGNFYRLITSITEKVIKTEHLIGQIKLGIQDEAEKGEKDYMFWPKENHVEDIEKVEAYFKREGFKVSLQADEKVSERPIRISWEVK